jgi:hypothetical protein
MPKNTSILSTSKFKYLLAMESEVIKPSNFDLTLHENFNKIFTWHDGLVDGKKYIKINFSHLFPDNIKKGLGHKEKLCTLIAGNKRVNHPLELYSKRIEAIRWFEKHYPDQFDLYGIGWDSYRHSNRYINYLLRRTGLYRMFSVAYPSYKGKVDSKKPVLEKYRFAICYENARDIPGYITEKIFDCFFAGCVPVYWGANNITDHIPENCFIDKRKFSTYEILYNYMSNMSDDEYLGYQKSIEFFLKSEQADPFRAERFAKTIVDTVMDDLVN